MRQITPMIVFRRLMDLDIDYKAYNKIEILSDS